MIIKFNNNNLSLLSLKMLLTKSAYYHPQHNYCAKTFLPLLIYFLLLLTLLIYFFLCSS